MSIRIGAERRRDHVAGGPLVKAGVLAVVACLLPLLLSAAALAQKAPEAASPVATTAAKAPVPTDYLDAFNGAMHGFNLWVNRKWLEYQPELPFFDIPESVSTAVPHVLLNFINEPVAAVSWAIAGDYQSARHALTRFWINTTQGWLGANDVALEQGLPPSGIDVGLALCSRGVGEGAQIVLPIIGPRTVRDFLSDFVVAHGILYVALAPVIGFPPSLESVAAIEGVEEVAQLGVIRQINHTPERNRTVEEVKAEYIAGRRAECQALIERIARLAP